MRKTILLLSLFLITLSSTFYSCKDTDIEFQGKGKVTISFNDESILKGRHNIVAVLLSIESASGEIIYSNERIELYSLGGEFISEELEMNTGDYYLTSFLLVNASNEVVFIAPIQGSTQAQYVSNPLPLWFSVFENEYTTVNPEVINVQDCGCSADSFGYVSFGFNIVSCDGIPSRNYHRGIIDIEVTGLFDEFHVFILPNSDMYYYEGNLNNATLAGFSYYFDGDKITELVEGSHYLGKHSDTALVTSAIDNGILVEEWEDWVFQDIEPCGSEMTVRKNVLDFGLVHEPTERELLTADNPDELRFRNFYGQNTTEILVCGQVYEYNNERQSIIAAELIDLLFDADEFIATNDESLNIYW